MSITSMRSWGQKGYKKRSKSGIKKPRITLIALIMIVWAEACSKERPRDRRTTNATATATFVPMGGTNAGKVKKRVDGRH